jgi:hypothetical protein
LRRSILACGLLLAFAGMTTAAAAAVGSGNTEPRATATATSTTASTTATPSTTGGRTRTGHRAAYWSRHIRHARAGTLRWLTVIRGRPPHRISSRSLGGRSVLELRRIARRWHRRERSAWRRASHPPALAGWLCIHHYEGSWTDSGGPYWGGLQMDLPFQERYGSWLLRHKGTADHWSPLEQIWAAVRASRERGFSPWPNTARYCGMA